MLVRRAFERYGTLDYTDKIDADDVHERVRSELRRAVTRRLVSDVPLGAVHPGGIDSSPGPRVLDSSPWRPAGP